VLPAGARAGEGDVGHGGSVQFLHR
jgi:hypothetical protein